MGEPKLQISNNYHIANEGEGSSKSDRVDFGQTATDRPAIRKVFYVEGQSVKAVKHLKSSTSTEAP